MKNANFLALSEYLITLVMLLIHFPQSCQFKFSPFDLFSKYSELHSNFIIWNSLSFQDLPESLLKNAHCQLSLVGENLNANFRDLKIHLLENVHDKITVFIFLNNSILDNLVRNIEQVEQNNQQFDFSIALKSRVSYFLFWQDTTVDDLQENVQLKQLSKKFSLSSDVYVVCLTKITCENTQETTPGTFDSQIDIFELYSIQDVSIVQQITISNVPGTCLHNSILTTDEFLDLKILNKVSRRRNFHFTKVIAVSQPGESNRIVMEEYENGTATLISGHEIEEYRFLRDYFNFSEYAVNSSGWAYVNEKGELMGMAAQVLNNQADIGITNSELMENFLKDLIFLHPTYFSTMRCFFVQPSSSSIRDIFLQPFTVNLWLAMFSTWTAIALTMISLLWMIHLKLHKLYEFEKSLLNEVWLWASGSACQQGWYFSPESTPAKIVLISGSTMSCIVVTAYSAILVAILSVKVYPVKSLDDLINQKFVIYRGSEIYSTNYILDELVSKGKIREKGSISSGEAVRKIMSSKFALLGIYDVFHPAARDEGIQDRIICSVLSQISVNWRPITAAMFLSKQSEYKEYFNYVLIKMHERGNRFRLLSHYMRNSSVLCEQHQDFSIQTNEKLELNDVFTAIAIMLSGVFISVAVLIMEKLLEKILRSLFIV